MVLVTHGVRLEIWHAVLAMVLLFVGAVLCLLRADMLARACATTKFRGRLAIAGLRTLFVLLLFAVLVTMWPLMVLD